MSTSVKATNERTSLIEEKLRPRFADSRAYQYNEASIRVRVVDPAFQGKSKSERAKMVSSLLEELPEDIEADITLLLLLTPAELSESMINVEFEHPSPSVL
jgi:stress-induced morphogen